MDKFKLIIKVLICFFFFIITSSVIIQWIVTVPNPLGLGFITPETKDTWINFFGAIIGGGATLLGVWWTLNQQQEQFDKNLKEQQKISNDTLAESRKQFEIELQKKDDELNLLKKHRKEDLIILYKPLLKMSIIETKEIMGGIIVFKILLENVGRGEANNINILFKSPSEDTYTIFPNKRVEYLLAEKQTIEIKQMIFKPLNKNYSDIIPFSKNETVIFQLELSYYHALDSTKKYNILACLNLSKIIPESEWTNISSVNQKEEPNLSWNISIVSLIYN